MRLRRLSLDPTSLVAGLVSILIGALGLAGTLDLRTFGGGWLIPGVLVALAVAVLAGMYRPDR
jgi:hypothetical protein